MNMEKKTILVVDDDKDLRSEIKDFLEDYKVVGASNGKEALGILRKPNCIDLVILDVIMPGLNGIEVLRKMNYRTALRCGSSFVSLYLNVNTLNNMIESYRHIVSQLRFY